MKYSIEIEGQKVKVATRPRKDFEVAVLVDGKRFCGLAVSKETANRIINREKKKNPELKEEQFTIVPVIKG